MTSIKECFNRCGKTYTFAGVKVNECVKVLLRGKMAKALRNFCGWVDFFSGTKIELFPASLLKFRPQEGRFIYLFIYLFD